MSASPAASSEGPLTGERPPVTPARTFGMQHPPTTPAPQTKRLIVQKITLDNFKSYAGHREIGPMHKRFTAVVGPNGSGKSNLIDALMFVFGKRAKKLRLKKVSELVHNSAEHPDCEEARVDVHFCMVDDSSPITQSEETDEYAVVPGSEFILSRVATRSNTSSYMLNNKRVAFEEVESFMMERGVDLNNNRFLILQGEVEAISMMKPKGDTKGDEGLLEFLEELIGTNKYVDEIDACQTRVEQLGQARAEKLNLVRVCEKEMQALEGPKDEALKYKSLEVDKLTKTIVLCELRLDRANAAFSAASAKQTLLKEKMSEVDTHSAERKAGLAVLEKEHEKIRAAHTDLLASLEEAKKDFAGFERRDIQDKAKLKQLQGKIEKLEAAVQEAREKHEAEVTRVDQIKREQPMLAVLVKQASDALVKDEEALAKLHAGLKGAGAEIREQLDKKQAELAPLAKAVREAQGDADVAKTETDLAKQDGDEAQAKLDEARGTLASLKQAASQLPGKISQAEAKCTKAKAERARVVSSIETLEKQEQQLSEDLVKSKARVETVKMASAQSQSRGQPLSALMEASKKGGPLEGCTLAGRLGDLGCVDPAFDVAASTGAGGLDSLVTETTEGAERCVKFLREHQLGTATFLMLDKLPAPGPAPADASLKRLFDLIRPNHEKFAPAFYYAVRDTLVADDLTQAVSVAYGSSSGSAKQPLPPPPPPPPQPHQGKAKFRVVTLKGELIDSSGTMSGGGKASKGRLRLSTGGPVAPVEEELDDEIANANLPQLEKQTAEMVQALTKARNELGALRQQLTGLNVDVTRAEEELRTLEMDLEANAQRVLLVTARIKELEPMCQLSAKDKERIAKLQDTYAAKVKALEQAKQRASAIEADIDSLLAKLNAVGGDSMKQAKARVEEGRAKLDAERTRLMKCEVALEAAPGLLSKSSSRIEKAGGDLERARVELEQAKASRLVTESKAREVGARFQVASQAEQEKRQALEKLKKEHAELKQAMIATESAAVETKIALEAADDEVKKASNDREKWTHDLHKAQSDLQVWSKDETSGEEGAQPPVAPLNKETVDEARIEVELKLVESEAAALRGNVNMGAVEEWRQREKEYLERVQELDQATAVRDEARQQCDELRKRRLVEFMAGFSIISLKLKEIYQLITLGGDAELELVDSLDPFSEGVVFSVRPPKKSWKNISNLSGGEKTLSSLSLVFALHYYKPAPLYVMDEIDAALDFKNVSIVANFCRERARNTQFLIISLRNNMFELADRLVGVYKTNNATKTVTINPGKVAIKSQLESSNNTADEENNAAQRRNASVQVEG